MGGHSQAPAVESCLLNASKFLILFFYFDINFSLSNAWIFFCLLVFSVLLLQQHLD